MNRKTLFVIGLVVVAAASRLIPHPPNFTPVAAIALFGAAHLPSKWLAFVLPSIAMFLSDLGLEAVTRLDVAGGWMAGGSGFYRDMWFVYAAVLLIAALGLLLRSEPTVWSIGAAVLASSVLFFLLTNFGVWLMWDMYPKSWEGLGQCYVAAIPFFHWTLLGDAFYATVLFGSFALARRHLLAPVAPQPHLVPSRK
jgi:hypothetical protein